jgi:tRNA A37 threonylcarbamoyladenosine synthetase subunit TsaC/SUA5/YrdC
MAAIRAEEKRPHGTAPAHRRRAGQHRCSVICVRMSAHSICVQVVPHFGGVLITTSPGRNANPSQRLLSDVTKR